MRARGIPGLLSKIMTRIPVHFLDVLCAQFVALPTPTPRVFEETRKQVDLLLSSVRRCEHVVVNKFGYGEEAKEVGKVKGTVLLMLSWINNILLTIMDPDLELEKERRCGRLAYQAHGHYVLDST